MKWGWLFSLHSVVLTKLVPGPKKGCSFCPQVKLVVAKDIRHKCHLQGEALSVIFLAWQL